MTDPKSDLDQLRRVRAMSPPEIFDEILDLFIADSQRQIGVMHEVLGAGDLEGLADAAHGIKGSSLALGLSDLSTAATELEHAARSGADRDYGSLVATVVSAFEEAEAAVKKLRAPAGDS